MEGGAMELKSISIVSTQFNISVRTLRYYEQIGLIKSERKEVGAYRYYSIDTVRRIHQVVILRKLRIPLKQIAEILENENSKFTIEVFEQNLSEIEDEITALSTIKNIIQTFIEKLHISNVEPKLLEDENLLEIIDSLTVSKINFREEKIMADLNKANKKLTKLTDRDVRIVYLPPMTLATIHIIGQDANGEHAEQTAAIIMDEFIKNINLEKVYPAARHFGFNNPDGVSDDDQNHGYERWVSIPDDMEVPAPLVKKRLNGGMYAARVIPVGAWNEGWEWLHEWVANSEKYDFRWGTIDGVCGWLEEHLNYWNWYGPNTTQQVDLLMPVKEKL